MLSSQMHEQGFRLMTESLDPRGHRIRAANQTAIDACIAGIEGFNTWRADAMGHLDGAIREDDDFALPRIAKGWALHLGRSSAYAEKVASLIGEAQARLDPGNDRESDLLAALRAAALGNSVEAGAVLESLLHRHPTDLFAHRVAQFELFWNGRSDWMRDLVETASPHWSEDLPGYGDFLSCRAFSNEEARDFERAEQCGRAAIEQRSSDPWGAHAVAHVLVMQGRVDAGRSWLEGLCDRWGDANQIRHHLWWHLCLFLLESGEHDKILELLESQIRNPESPLVQAVPDATIDIQNVASLLLRLELRGVEVGDRWQVLAEICAGRIHNHANAFSNAHDMMVLSATGQFDEAAELLASMRNYANSERSNLSLSYSCVGIPICEAILAHRKNDFEHVVRVLSPVRHDLSLIGASHAQRDVFYQILIDAAHRAGHADLVAVYLNDVARTGFTAPHSRTLYRNAA